MRLSKNSTKVFATTSTLLLAALLGIGCSDSKPATPKVAIESFLGPGTETNVNTSNKCLLRSEAWATIGNPDNTTVEDGTPVDGSHVTVECEVRPDGDGFYVKASGLIQGRKGFNVSGHFTATGDQNVLATWTDPSTGIFQQDNCIAKYDHSPQGVAAGRVWAQVTCPHAALQGTSDRICQGTSEFRFENCAQD
ncbi:hypothetical protein LZC95_36040 [Pendulispora brunnea]|uniref:Uncharacterized protein n=1 Tax=Pendulispora brunnea TaxID=2905690 RepID=A0ABZ2K3Z6_9BACT